MSTTSTGSRTYLYIDILNILACFCVIFLHHNSIVHGNIINKTWAHSLIVEVIAYWAVPVFLMISGATLFTYRERYSTIIFFKKRFFRVVLPFLVWSIIMLLWLIATNQIDTTDLTLTKIINLIIGCNVINVYWYFPDQISLLTNSKNILLYIASVIFIFSSLLTPLLALLGIYSLEAFSFPMTSLILFVILGYLFHNYDFTPKQRIIIYILGLFGAFFRYTIIYYLSMKSGYKNPIFFNYVSFPSVFLASAVYIFFKYNTPNLTNKYQHIIKKVSSCSLGIYLIHIAIMYYERKIWDIDIYSPVYITYMTLETYIICLAIVYMFKKSRHLNFLFP